MKIKIKTTHIGVDAELRYGANTLRVIRVPVCNSSKNPDVLMVESTKWAEVTCKLCKRSWEYTSAMHHDEEETVPANALGALEHSLKATEIIYNGDEVTVLGKFSIAFTWKGRRFEFVDEDFVETIQIKGAA